MLNTETNWKPSSLTTEKIGTYGIGSSDDGYISMYLLSRTYYRCGEVRLKAAINKAQIEKKRIANAICIHEKDLNKLIPYLGKPFENRVAVGPIAKKLRCGVSTVMKLANELKLNPIKFKRQIEFSESDVQNMENHFNQRWDRLHDCCRTVLAAEFMVTTDALDEAVLKIKGSWVSNRNGYYLSREDYQKLEEHFSQDSFMATKKPISSEESEVFDDLIPKVNAQEDQAVKELAHTALEDQEATLQQLHHYGNQLLSDEQKESLPTTLNDKENPIPQSMTKREAMVYLRIGALRLEKLLKDFDIQVQSVGNAQMIAGEDIAKLDAIVQSKGRCRRQPANMLRSMKKKGLLVPEDSSEKPMIELLPQADVSESTSDTEDLLELLELNDSLSAEIKLQRKLIKTLKKENKFFRKMLLQDRIKKKKKKQVPSERNAITRKEIIPDFSRTFADKEIEEVEEILLQEFDKFLNYKLNTDMDDHDNEVFLDSLLTLIGKMKIFFETSEGDLGPIDQVLNNIYCDAQFMEWMQCFYMPIERTCFDQDQFDCLIACLGELYSKDQFQLRDNGESDCVHLFKGQ